MKQQKNKSNRMVTVVVLLAITLIALLTLFLIQGGLGNGLANNSPIPTGDVSPNASKIPIDTNTPEPTLTPEPTPTPEITDPEQLVLEIQNPPSFVSKTAISEGTYQKKFSDGATVTYSVYQNNKKVEYKPEYVLAFPSRSEERRVGKV